MESTEGRFREYVRTRDRRLRDELVLEYFPLAQGLARRFGGRMEPLDDLTQVAALALLKAVERYDPVKGTSFTAFAVPTILGELRRHFRDSGWTIHVPRRLQELVLTTREVRAILAQDLGRPPQLQEIADRMGVKVEEVLEAMNAALAYRPSSLDAEEPGGVPRADVHAVSAGERSLEEAEERDVVRHLLRSLGRREREIVYLRFYEDLTQTEIAQRMGISQMQVSRLLARCAERMRGRAS